MESYNQKYLEKHSCKICVVCKDYYEGGYCKDCFNNTYNLYNTVKVLERYNILPSHLFTKLLLIFSQIQVLYPLMNMINYDYILYKILELMGEPIYTSIKYVFCNPVIWARILKLIMLGVIVIL